MATIRLRRNTSVQWAALNPVLLSGEQGYETDTGFYRIGDGVTKWNALDTFIPAGAILEMIQEAMAQDSDGGTTPTDLGEHINSSTPHPVYDDGPSFFLLYQNAKV